MKKLLRKKADPSQQSDPPPTVQKSPPLPPPLFARFASSHSTGSSPSPVISGPVALSPRESVRRQNGPNDGSPPRLSTPRVVASQVQRNRMPFEKQPTMNGGRDNKTFPDPEQTLTQRSGPHAFYREKGQSLESRYPPMSANDPSPKPQKYISELGRREGFSREAESASESLDSPSTPTKSEDIARKFTHTSASSSPERKPSARPAPVPEPVPSPFLAFQNPPDRPQPRRKYSPLEAFGLMSGENSPVPSTTTSSVNLPSQNLVSLSSNVPILSSHRDRSFPYQFRISIFLRLS